MCANEVMRHEDVEKYIEEKFQQRAKFNEKRIESRGLILQRESISFDVIYEENGKVSSTNFEWEYDKNYDIRKAFVGVDVENIRITGLWFGERIYTYQQGEIPKWAMSFEGFENFWNQFREIPREVIDLIDELSDETVFDYPSMAYDAEIIPRIDSLEELGKYALYEDMFDNYMEWGDGVGGYSAICERIGDYIDFDRMGCDLLNRDDEKYLINEMYGGNYYRILEEN